MKFLRITIIPIILLGVIGLITLLFFSSLPNSSKILLCPLIAELLLVIYFWKYQLVKKTKSGLFFIYLTFLVLSVFIVKLITTFLYANGTLEWELYLIIYFSFLGVAFVAGTLLKIIYGGVNESIKMQFKGEHSLSKMKELCLETIFVLEQYKKSAKEPIKLLKEVAEAIEFSDPVTHKKASLIEKEIITGLKEGLRHGKNKHFNKIETVMKDSNGVLFLIQKRNSVLKNYK